MKGETIKDYRRTNGDHVVMEYIQGTSAAFLVMHAQGQFIQRSHLAKPFRESADIVADRWKAEDDAKYAGAVVHFTACENMEAFRAVGAVAACGADARVMGVDRWVGSWMPAYQKDPSIVTCMNCKAVA